VLKLVKDRLSELSGAGGTDFCFFRYFSIPRLIASFVFYPFSSKKEKIEKID
jgi:hypothetical protein